MTPVPRRVPRGRPPRAPKRHALPCRRAITALLVLLAPAIVSRVVRAGAMPPNVLLVTLDTTRADRLGCYGWEPALTPSLDGLAARGVTFTQAFSPCPLTLPAHATILTGLEPAQHGLRINRRAALGTGVRTLAEVLRDRGYATGAFVGAYVVNRRFGLDRGFTVYDDDLSRPSPQEIP